MATDDLANEWTVAEILRRYPATTMGFIRLRTACVGCALARFCRLDDVAEAYNLPVDDIRRALLESAREGEAGTNAHEDTEANHPKS